MTLLADTARASSSTAPAAAWEVRALSATRSTNEEAARLPAWHAVTAETQSAGRGRHARHWVSDRGGLWLSAVLPAPAPLERWSVLPLAAGWAVCAAVSDLGVAGARLRWPNDIMVGRAKLAGILVERFTAETAVVGIGLNLENRPEQADATLAGAVARLADLLHPAPPLAVVRDRLLERLAAAHAWIAHGDAARLAAALQPFWRLGPVRAQLRRGDTLVEGRFAGVDAAGRLQLVPAHGDALWLDPVDVELLREIFPPDFS